ASGSAGRLRSPPAWRCARDALLQTQLGDTLLVEAEHVPDLVEERHLDLLDQLRAGAAGALEVALEEEDPRGQAPGVVLAALELRGAREEPEHVGRRLGRGAGVDHPGRRDRLDR